MLKRWTDFAITENKRTYDYACLLLDIRFPKWQMFLDKIDPEDLYESEKARYGLEDEPHITALYGLHEEVSVEMLRQKLGDLLEQPIDIEIQGIGIFSNEDYDVVKLNVQSQVMTKINKILRQLPHTTDYPDYKPHITIAYVKKGLGQKYVQDLKMNFLSPPNWRYSLASGEQVLL